MSIKHVKSITIADGTNTNVVMPSDWLSNHNIIYNLSGNTTGSSQLSGQDVILVGGSNMTLSADTAGSKLVFSAPAASSLVAGANITISTAGSNISIIGAAGGGGGAATVGGAELFPLDAATAFSTMGQNSIYFQKFIAQSNVSFNNIERRASLSSASSSIAVNVNHTIDYGMYTQMTGASSTQYSLAGSSRMVINASYSSNLSAGFTVSQGAASVTNTSAGTVNMSALSGFKHLYMPFTSTITAGGNYAVAMRMSSASTGNTGALRLGFKELTMYSNLSVGRIDVNAGISISNASRVGDWAQGVYSATSSNLPNTLAVSGLTNQVSQARMYLQFDA
jgi:hypothetical protein